MTVKNFDCTSVKNEMEMEMKRERKRETQIKKDMQLCKALALYALCQIVVLADLH